MIAAMSFGGALSKSAKIALAKGAWLELPPILGSRVNGGRKRGSDLLIGQYNRG